MYKLTEKCRAVLPRDIVVLLERPDVVELVRYFNGRLISYKEKDEQERIKHQKEKALRLSLHLKM
jgi:hypothetical protein